MDDLSFDAFAARMEKAFVLRRVDSAEPREPIEAALVECAESPEYGGFSGYSLTFRASPSAPPEQGTYLIEGAGLTPTPIFLVPVSQTPDGVDFHAVFTQLTESANAL